MTDHPAPIGVFDSGMGGLTVLRALQNALPDENFIYLGDTARLPYGSKSPATVERYALQATEILVERGIRALVVACNTASAFALSAIERRYPGLPVFGVVEPGAQAAAERAADSAASGAAAAILVLATESTVLGGAYQSAILERRPDLRVHARACPLLVVLAEEGEHEGAFCESVLRHYLHGHIAAQDDRQGPDGRVAQGSISSLATVVLGCTHFPVFKPALEKLLPANTVIVDSAVTTARQVASMLNSSLLDRVEGVDQPDQLPSPGSLQLLATDGVDRFRRVGRFFLGSPLADVELVDL
jgi:glutamate racemase